MLCSDIGDAPCVMVLDSRRAIPERVRCCCNWSANTCLGRGARQCGHAGAEIKVSKPKEDKNPQVQGRLGRNPDVPTVTFYGHYDVQPAMEREWATNPFEIAAIDGYLYGRGTSDNKVTS